MTMGDSNSAPPAENEIAMKAGAGGYNKNSSLQGRATEPALNLMPDLSGRQTVAIADYGCSQGANSIVPLSKLISTIDAGASVQLIFNDRPFNDWNELSATIKANKDILNRHGDLNTFPSMSPISFFNAVAPPQTLDVGVAFSSFSYLEHQLPTPPSSSVEELVKKRGERKAEQARTDLVKLLTVRASEIKPGGYFICAVGGKVEGRMTCAATTYAMMKAIPDMMKAGIMSMAQMIALDAQIIERTEEELVKSLGEVAELWEVEKVTHELIEHPAWDILQAKLKEGGKEDVQELTDAKQKAYRDYAEEITSWVLSAFSWYFVRALRAEGPNAGKGPEIDMSQDEEEKLLEFKQRIIDYVVSEFKDLDCGVDYFYFRLLRK